MTFQWYDVLGLLGVVAVVLAYFGLQAGRLRANGSVYQILNAVGALAILVSLMFDFNLPSFVMEAMWLLISIYGMARAARLRRERKATKP